MTTMQDLTWGLLLAAVLVSLMGGMLMLTGSDVPRGLLWAWVALSSLATLFAIFTLSP